MATQQLLKSALSHITEALNLRHGHGRQGIENPGNRLAAIGAQLSHSRLILEQAIKQLEQDARDRAELIADLMSHVEFSLEGTETSPRLAMTTKPEITVTLEATLAELVIKASKIVEGESFDVEADLIFTLEATHIRGSVELTYGVILDRYRIVKENPVVMRMARRLDRAATA